MAGEALYNLWPNSALIRNKYMAIRDRSTHVTPDQLKRDTNFEATLSTLQTQLVEYHRSTDNRTHYDFPLTIHEIYRLIITDELKVFALFGHDVLLLLARVDISHIPPAATADYIGIFDMLLSEITKRYDDYSIEFQSVLHRTSKIMGVFLISCLHFSRLTKENIYRISLFVLKLTQYYLTLTELVDYWFTRAANEPDVMFLLTKKKLPPDCFPIYELTKNFLFMDDDLAKAARDTLLHVILISCFSPGLQHWVLESDMPTLLLSGLLATFNQFCYNDVLMSNAALDFNELSENNANFREFDDFMKFVMEIISYASHDSIRISFLNGLHTKFILPLMEYFQADCIYQMNALMLFTHTLDRLILPADINQCTSSLIIDFLLDHYFLAESECESTNILVLYTATLLDWGDNPNALIPIFKLTSTLSRVNSPTLLCVTLFTEASQDLSFLQPHSIFPLALKVKFLISADPKLAYLLISSLDSSYKRLKDQLSLFTEPRKLLLFDPGLVLSSVICVELFGFFNHGISTNEQLVWMVMDLVSSNTGFVTDLMCNDGRCGGIFSQIFEYLWLCFTNYELKLSQGRELIHRVRPSSDLLEMLCKLGPVPKQRLTIQEQISKDVLSVHLLKLNVDLFKTFVIRLYATQRATFTLHNIRYSIV